MVTFYVKCKSAEEMIALRNKMHLGLVGSPAYINSEIAVCDLQDDEFALVIGDCNEHNVEYDVRSSDILER